MVPDTRGTRAYTTRTEPITIESLVNWHDHSATDTNEDARLEFVVKLFQLFVSRLKHLLEYSSKTASSKTASSKITAAKQQQLQQHLLKVFLRTRRAASVSIRPQIAF